MWPSSTFLKIKTPHVTTRNKRILYATPFLLYVLWLNHIPVSLPHSRWLCGGGLTLTTGAVEGERARTIGRPKAETTMAAVTKYANSLHGLLPPVSSDTLRAIMLGIGANT